MREAAVLMEKEGIEDPFWHARVIAAHLLGKPPSQLVNIAELSFLPEELESFFSLVDRRLSGEPLQYVIGNWDFYGRTFLTEPAALIPRPETEILVTVVLGRCSPDHLRILDAGTGSGVIGITLALEMPSSTVIGTDISVDAISLARRNALLLGASNFLPAAGNLADALRGGFDVITANLPYIPTGEMPGLPPEIRNYEPHLALDGGDDGTFTILELVNCAHKLLNPGGFIAVETGCDQKKAVTEIFSGDQWASVETHEDYGGRHRIVTADRGPVGIR